MAATPPAQETDRDERMRWWREARFGMFIHWGLYSVLGGEWQGFDHGKEMGGASAEWIMLRANIPKQEYASLAKRFNPVKFDAAAWVSTAKAAGMKYMVITAKHHDGFSMYSSKLTEYDIVDATPFGRDVIKELSDECRRQGLRFGIYYSHSKDWYNRKQVNRDPERPTKQYVEFVQGQLRELLANYGDMAIIWFDTGDQFTDVNTSHGELVRKLQPKALISGRLHGREEMSDYRQEGDRRIPARRVEGDAESPMTLRDNWGWDRDDSNWKSDKEMIERLSLCVARGANMLLNVGPKPDGTLAPEEVRALRAIGRWMDVNGEAIHGTQASPFDFDFEWGSMTRKPGKLYLHVLRWNPDGIEFPGLRSRVKRAYLLADPDQDLRVEQSGGMTLVKVPPKAPDNNVSVIALELAGNLEVDENVQGKYHWVKETGIRLNEEKMKQQRARGWKP
ncbi:MAG: alpha-L-fucosidase [bacterium]|nr:alpha-L-fucosidase [bacterium]